MPAVADSGNISGIDWDEGILVVSFKKGGMYEYYDIPIGLYYEFLAAPSKNTFLRDNIVGKYEYGRV